MAEPKNMMKLVGLGADHQVFSHKDTGVMYLVVGESLSPRAVCVMVDAEGKPLIYKERTDV